MRSSKGDYCTQWFLIFDYKLKVVWKFIHADPVLYLYQYINKVAYIRSATDSEYFAELIDV